MAGGKRQSTSSPASSVKSASAGKVRSSKRQKKIEEPVEVEPVVVAEKEISPPSSPSHLKEEDEDEICQSTTPSVVKPAARRRQAQTKKEEDSECRMVGVIVDTLEAQQRWPHRYTEKVKKCSSVGAISCTDTDNSEGLRQAKCHYLQAEVDGIIYNLNDDAHVQAEDGKPHYICKIVELFVGVDGNPYFRAQWFYRAEDTVIGESIQMTESKRVFLSEVKDDNPLDCLVEKLNIVKVSPNVDVEAKLASIPDCDYYYDMLYLLPYNTFLNATQENVRSGSPATDSASTISTDDNVSDSEEVSYRKKSQASSMRLLDLYCGCGAMSTGLCQGANIYGLNLVTRWAVDLNEYACESVRLNHPETEVRNEEVGDFLDLIKEWEKLCVSFGLVKGEKPHEVFPMTEEMESADDDDEEEDVEVDNKEIFEVDEILAICYGLRNNEKERKLYVQVRWKGYGPDEDSWEPVDGMSGCREKIKQYVTNGFNEKILPLPGDVDMICGGPPCQGISGFNRFRDKNKPLDGDQNSQIEVYMKVVEYLKPKFVLMENVVDLLKFASGFLGKYSLGRLVNMNYQARVGMLAAGAYGLPQFRMRVFIWGARPTETLSKYPLPTHDVVKRGVVPVAFESNVVAHEEGHKVPLKDKLLLSDVMSDLPEVTNYENREERPYGSKPKTDFQRFIRLKKDAYLSPDVDDSKQMLNTLFDHIPLELNTDDYNRVCKVPKKKGANFRDFPGVRVNSNKVVEWDPDVPRVLLPSGKPLVPDYAMSFVEGRSTKPFARLWWDEIVPTVVTRAEPHNQAILHPLQDRVLTVRENARIQGFPDYYKLQGPTKKKYIQVGNAVAVPVARALGYALGMATSGIGGYDPVFSLPTEFPRVQKQQSSPSCSEEPAIPA